MWNPIIDMVNREECEEVVKARGTDSAKIIQVIETKALAGGGKVENPVRLVTQYWDFDGHLLAYNDPHYDDSVGVKEEGSR